jgi:hypothetical protein
MVSTQSHTTVTDTTLLRLDEVCLQTVLQHLSAADRRRLSRTCRCLRHSWRKSVHAAAISQEDLELYDDQPLCACPHLKQLQLNSLDLDQDCSSFLQDAAVLQQLRILQVHNPQQLQPQALRGLIAVCSMLTSLQITGDWHCAEGDAAVQLPSQRPANLQQLHVLHNSSIAPSELYTWLSSTAAAVAAHCEPLDASASSGCCVSNSSSGRWQLNSTGTNISSNSKAAAYSMQQQLLRLLLKEAAADGATTTTAAAASIEELSLLQPAWPHLQELDLSGAQ